ncbi:Arv1-like family-domain-containing protein [Crassisporium funariophilum]|nr:Arv1-like family-domain-containing protein [Crassisporium funariophilum]
MCLRAKPFYHKHEQILYDPSDSLISNEVRTMPICTSCTQSIPYLYTVYESEYNLRLEQCPKCHQFVDPYVEHDSLTILLDLILLKRGVYRHLLYNRGSKPRKLVGGGTNAALKGKQPATISQDEISRRECGRWFLVMQLGSALILVDAFIRWSYLNPHSVTPWTAETFISFFRVFLGTCAETVAFHGGIMLSCYSLMKLADLFQTWRLGGKPTQSSIRQEFRLSLISLSLFYSSLPKVFLLLLLTIWLPTGFPSSPPTENPLPDWAKLLWKHDSSAVASVLKVLDDDKLDREWIVRNVLGGMSAGFGLRVILDIHTMFTTIIILAGWASKTLVATLVSKWVGGNDSSGEAWLAYSIP